MRMIVAKLKDHYGARFNRYINPEKVRMISNTRDGTSIEFDNGEELIVGTSVDELVKQWEHCNDEVALKESEVAK